jgi:hypothetical protein
MAGINAAVIAGRGNCAVPRLPGAARLFGLVGTAFAGVVPGIFPLADDRSATIRHSAC